MRDRDDWIELELGKQKQRLNYIRTLVDRKPDGDYRPRRIFFEPTNACNLRCGHCAAHNGSMTRKQGYMDWDLYCKVMEEVKDWNRTTEIMLYQHGESTLHPRITDMVHKASVEYDFFTKLNTNGVALFKEKSRALIKANIDSLVFTVDAITPETYRRIKGRPHFERVLNNILDFLEVWGEEDRGDYPNYFACDLFLVEEDSNREDISIIRKMFERLPVGHVEVYELFNYMGAVQAANGKYPERFSVPREQWPVCNTPWDILGLRWNGDAVACIYDYDNRYVVGNIRDQTIEEIWHGERMQAFRQAQLDHQFDAVEKNGVLCSNCTIMWQDLYQAPDSFHEEVKKMSTYLSRAVDRVSQRHDRTRELMEKHAYLKANRQQWVAELMERIKPIQERERAS